MMRYETKVVVFQEQPNAAQILELLKSIDLGGTELSEWQFSLERFANTPSHTVAFFKPYRWELTFKRNIA